MKNNFPKIHLTILFLLMLVGSLHGQASDSMQISIRTRPTKTVIAIRWSAGNTQLWTQTNACGFWVERYAVKKDGKLLDAPIKTVLNTEPLKAKPLNEWETIAKSNNYSAIIAQALYGKSFELTKTKPSVMDMVNESRQQDQRFLVAMYAADLSYEAALHAGWAYTDNTAEKGTFYLYKVIPADAKLAASLNGIGSYTSLDMYEELPKPLDFSANWTDSAVSFAWDNRLQSQIFVAYRLEKSEDGKTFSSATAAPIMNMTNSPVTNHVDSLQQNNKKYYYRLCGISPFGEQGPYTDAVSGKGEDILTYSPSIQQAIINKKGEVEITWEFDERGNTLITGFELQRADADQGPYQTVLKNIATKTRTITFPKPAASNYFIVAAIPLTGEPIQSFSSFVQPIDSIPPAIPQKLSYTIDSTGIVKLKWQANTEKDLQGYRIYRAMTATGEYILLNDSLAPTATYTDSINVKSLQKSAFYRISAADGRYNQSALSEVLEVKKPDLIPPTSPAIKNFGASAEGNVLEWINPNDKDLAKIRIYRSMAKDTAILLTEITNLKQSSYTDTDLQYGVTYTYTLAASDKSGLQSTLTPPVAIRSLLSAEIKVSAFIATRLPESNTITLSWKIRSTAEIKEIQIYRKANNEQLSIWQNLEGTDTEITDNVTAIGNAYEYMLHIIPKSGKSVYSKVVKIAL